MSGHTSNQAPNHTSTNLSFSFNQLRAKLTSPPPSPVPNPPSHPPAIHVRPTDTPETASLLLTSSPTAKADNPPRAVYFPHLRVSGPGTSKCVGRPDRPQLRVDTDVPVVSIARHASRYGTPWRSAAPARYGPSGMESWEMGGWLKGTRGEVVEPSPVVAEDEEGPWFEIRVGDGEGEVVLLSGEGEEGDVADRAGSKNIANCGPTAQDSGYGTRVESTAIPRQRRMPSEGEREAYWKR